MLMSDAVKTAPDSSAGWERILFIPFDHLNSDRGVLKDANPRTDLVLFVKNHRMARQVHGLDRLTDLPELKVRAKEVLAGLDEGSIERASRLWSGVGLFSSSNTMPYAGDEVDRLTSVHVAVERNSLSPES